MARLSAAGLEATIEAVFEPMYDLEPNVQAGVVIECMKQRAELVARELRCPPTTHPLQRCVMSSIIRQLSERILGSSSKVLAHEPAANEAAPQSTGEESAGDANATGSIRIAIRVRPFNKREKDLKSACVMQMHGAQLEPEGSDLSFISVPERRTGLVMAWWSWRDPTGSRQENFSLITPTGRTTAIRAMSMECFATMEKELIPTQTRCKYSSECTAAESMPLQMD